MRSKFTRTTASCLVLSIIFSLMPVMVHADEGMYLPDTIGRLPLDRLKKRGLKIPISDIYNPTGPSIKDAVVIIGGGTGEFVSPEGLILTNHHVAFDALVAASDATHDYGNTGFTAQSRATELPAEDYTVTITQDLKDVTNEVLNGLNLTTPDRSGTIQKRAQAMESAGTRADEGIQVRVLALNEGLAYYQFTYQILRDIRLVYAPPKSIGYFGGDPDNFEWPRHCGDFAFMRAYIGPNGKPATYSDKNVPFKPKKFLTLSAAGVKEGDLMMVLGYPGSTRRYRESYSVAYNQDVAQPFFIDLLAKQIEVLEQIGEDDPARRVKLQGPIFDLNNTLKNFEGSVLALRREDVVGKKRVEEAEFTKWIDADPGRKEKYSEVLPSLDKAYDTLNKTAQKDLLVQQLGTVSGLLDVGTFALLLAAEKEKPETERNATLLSPAALQRAKSRVISIFADRNPILEREMLVYLLRKAAALPPVQKIEALEKRFANLSPKARREAELEFARSVIESKRFATAETVSALFDMTQTQLRDLREPLLDFAGELNRLISQARGRTQIFNAAIFQWRPLLLEGMSMMKGGMTYPDANRTLRFSYGDVKSYSPRESITYTAFTTLAGVIEKDTGREPFDVPEKLKQLQRAGDFGNYGNTDKSSVPVNFISTADIIGGNSGSPILNGRGEQVGIVFDGNYEGLGNDFFYNEARGRSISVDIRYVLFITEKFGSAGHVLSELDIKHR